MNEQDKRAMESLIEMTDQELDTAVESAKQAEVDAYLKTLQWSNETSDEVKTLVAGNIRGFAFRETTPQSPINQFISRLAVDFSELKKRLARRDAELAQLREKLAAVNEDKGRLKDEYEKVFNKMLRYQDALVTLRDCDWVITLPDRMDAVRNIARKALAIIDGNDHSEDVLTMVEEDK